MVEKAHKRALRATYNDFNAFFTDLLDRAGHVTIHNKHLHFLMTEIFKSIHSEDPPFMKTLFDEKPVKYDLRRKMLLKLPPTRTVKNGTMSVIFKGSLIWNTLPNSYKTAKNISHFKSLIRQWDGNNCTCKICN